MPRNRDNRKHGKRKRERDDSQELSTVVNLPPPVPDDAKLFLNRELSLLEFQRRVLEEAQDPANPLLERVKFLAIVGSNMAEFFMVRVGALRHQVEAGVTELSMDGLSPTQQLAAIRPVALELMRDARECLRDLLPQLAAAGIHVLDYSALSEVQRHSANDYFERLVFPVLTPLAYDPGRPFPHISNMSLNLAVIVRDRQGRERFARVKVPRILPRLVPVARPPGSNGDRPRPQCFVWLEQLIAANLSRLFTGMEVVEAHPFRVARDAEMEIQEMEAEDLLETIERGVWQRRFGAVVRLTIDPQMPDYIREILIDNMDIDPSDVYVLDSPLGMSDLMGLYALDRPDLKEPAFQPNIPTPLADPDEVFARLRENAILLHHPYDSFAPVVSFLQTAARDPNVLAIKQTLYRVGQNSPVVDALLEAVLNGKQVAVLVELKARFDEASNIEWARALEREGVHVVYGLLGLKTHSKIALIIRREGDRLQRYVHLSTGNYNAVSAQNYTDLGLFTTDDVIGDDASDLFNYLTGYSDNPDYQKLLVAPVNLRARLEQLIERETTHARRGDPAHLIFKVNSLVDKPVIQALYRASQAGVKVDLLVRGVCCLRPGVPGLSDNIRVLSIVGRFLEHSRVFYFHNSGDHEVYLGSADLMTRNLDRRVEAMFPVEDRHIVRHICDNILGVYLADTAKARAMTPSGAYRRVTPPDGETPFNSQEWLIANRLTLQPNQRWPAAFTPPIR